MGGRGGCHGSACARSQFESQASEAARGRFSVANCGACRRVVSFRLTGFLGFPRGRPRNTSVGSVSTSEGLMCTDLIGEWFDLLERSET